MLQLELTEAALKVEFEAPYHGDPPPPGPAGHTDGLWNHEVVELFLLGADAHYLELEFGPAGHHLCLRLRGVRALAPAASAPVADYRCAIRAGRWHGEATVEVSELPAGLHACNAYAIHGVGAQRRYLAAQPVPGPAPDFHRLERFVALPWE